MPLARNRFWVVKRGQMGQNYSILKKGLSRDHIVVENDEDLEV